MGEDIVKIKTTTGLSEIITLNPREREILKRALIELHESDLRDFGDLNIRALEELMDKFSIPHSSI